MSVNGKLILAVKMLLERGQYKADLDKAVADTQDAAKRIEGGTRGVADAVQSVVGGQSVAVNAAARAMTVLGPVAASAAAAAVAVGVAYHQAQQENLAFQRSIILTGNAAGVTSGQLSDMARNVDAVAGTHAKAAATLAEMTGTARIARENLQLVTLAAVEMERTTVQSIGESVKVFSDLGREPVAASAKLNESLNFLTASTFEQIKAADELGRTEEAASIAQSAYANAMRERTAKVEASLGYLQRFMRGVRETAAEMWDAILNIGREQGPQALIAAQERTVAALESQLARGGTATGGIERQLGAARQRLEALRAEASASAAAAAAERDRAAADRAGIELSQEASKHASTLEKTRKAVALATEQYTTAIKREGLTQQERAQIDANYLQVVTSLTQAKEKQARAGAPRKESGGDPFAAERAGAQQWARVMETAGKAIDAVQDKTQGLNAAQQALLGYLTSPAYAQNTEDMRQAALNRLYAWDAAIKHAEATKDEAAALALASKAIDTWQTASSKETATLQAQVEALRDEAAALGLSAVETASLTAAKHEQAAAEKEAYAAALDSARLYAGEYSEAYAQAAQEARKQAALLRELAGQSVDTAGRRALLDDWRQSVDQYSEVFRRGFSDMLNAGKDGWKSFTRSLATTFKTTVADQLYKAFAQPFVVKVVGQMLGLSGMLSGAGSNSGGGLMGGIQTASNINSLWGAGSQALYGGTAGASMASLGYANVVGAMGGDAIGALATANGMWAGVATGAQAAAQSAIAANLAIEAGAAAALPAGTLATASGAAGAAGGAAAGSGISGALSAVPVWGWALAAVAVLGSMLSKKQTLHSGAGAIYSADKGLQEGAGIYNLSTFGMGDVREYNKDGQALASGIATGLGTTLDGLAKAFGQKAGFEVATAFADDTSKDGAWGSLRISKDGKDLLNWNETRTSRWAPREFADGEAGQKEYLAAIARDTRQVLLDMDLPGWADTLLMNIGDVADMDKLSAAVAQIGQAQAAFESFGEYMPTFAGLADSAKTALVAASGGVNALMGNMSTFVENFYTDEEKLAVNTENVREAMAKLGFEMPTTREGFKALVQSQIALGDAGAKTLAGLLGLSGAFSAVTAGAQDAKDAAEELARKQAEQRDKALRALERAVAAEQRALQSRLDAANDIVNTMGNLFGLLHNSVRDLYGEVDSTREMLAQQGGQFIAQALATARESGAFPDAERLAEAISDARAGLERADFATSQDRDYAALVLAGQLSELEDMAGKQLTDAQRTVRELQTHTKQLDETLDNWRELLDISSGTQEAILSVTAAVEQLRQQIGEAAPNKPGEMGGTGGSAGASRGGGGSTPSYANTGPTPRASYGADEALSSFDKFKAWYNGIRYNADPSLFDGTKGYKVPDWMRVHNGPDDGTDQEMFGSYLFYKNNPQYAKDFEQVYSTGKTSYSTDGSTLSRFDLSEMPPEVADFYRNNHAALLASEGFGLDPTLAYQLYTSGPERFGLDGKRQSFTQWLRDNKWTADGVVANNNVVDYAHRNYQGMRLPKWDTTTGNIVDLDGSIYTPEGKFVGTASRAQMEALFGKDFLATEGGAGYGNTMNSSLYNSQVGAGRATAEEYYSAIRTNLDKAINDGWTAQQLVDGLRSTGASLADAAKAYGISVDEVRKNLIAGGATNLPAFADGGLHTGGLRIVGERGWELEATGPSRIWNQQQLAQAIGGGGNNARLEALVEALTAEVAALKAAANATAQNTSQSAAVLVAARRGDALCTTPEPAF